MCKRYPSSLFTRLFTPVLYVIAAWFVLMAGVASVAGASEEPSVEQLKTRLAAASVGDRPKICVQIARQQLTESARLYADGDAQKAQSALTDVVTYSEQARDYSIQSHKYEKQTEIAVRGMTRKLNDLLHTLTNDEQPAVHEAINQLQRVRDDLLIAMFPKGQK
jgi:hypothetical protein